MFLQQGRDPFEQRMEKKIAYNIVTAQLFHTICFSPSPWSLSCLSHPIFTAVLCYWKKLTCWVIRSFDYRFLGSPECESFGPQPWDYVWVGAVNWVGAIPATRINKGTTP